MYRKTRLTIRTAYADPVGPLTFGYGYYLRTPEQRTARAYHREELTATSGDVRDAASGTLVRTVAGLPKKGRSPLFGSSEPSPQALYLDSLPFPA